MRVYNFFSTKIELHSYLRQPRKGKEIYSSTHTSQPFLREFPIHVFMHYNQHTEKLILKADIYRNKEVEFLLASFHESNEFISEDLVEWENQDYKISLQAISSLEAYIVWENKKESSNQIIFSGKIKPLNRYELFLLKWKN